jgi:ATP-binding cassette, subfamily B, bacterial MsbA
MDHTGKAILKRLLKEHIMPYRKRLAIAVCCMFVAAVSAAGNAWIMQPALDQIFIERNRNMLALIPLGVFLIAVVGASANYGNMLSLRFIGQRVIADMQKRLFTHLMYSDLGLFTRESSGRLISRFTNDIHLLRNAFSTVLTAIAKESLAMVFLIGVMFYQNFELALISLIVFPIAIYPLIRLGKRMRRISDKTQNELGEFTATLDEIFYGVRTVKSYNREAFEIQRASNIIESLFALYYKASRIQAAASPMMEVLSGVSIALVIWYGGFQVLDGSTTPGAFFSFITAFLMAYKPVRAMAGLNTVLQEGIASASRLYKVLDTPPSIADTPGAVALDAPRGHIRYEQVSFQYAPDSQGVANVSFEVPAGKTAALVGLSGSGKSTLMNLLLRFYDVQGGSITIDGHDIRDVTLYSLRQAMSFVPQESMLFDDTIMANIAYGREGASDAEVIEAANFAAADMFIRSLPEGYNTLIGSHGVRLSGGQRQRIAIARAMLKNAPILLLDEATSSLDNESERAVQDALSSLMQGRTTLVIAHRLSTIVNADIIYVVDGGVIVESGNHESLMKKQGRYWQLYARNFEAELPL